MMGYGMMGFGWGWALIMISIIIVVILGIFALIRYLQQPIHHDIRQANSHALDLLNERYAKGEISNEEYNRIKADIRAK